MSETIAIAEHCGLGARISQCARTKRVHNSNKALPKCCWIIISDAMFGLTSGLLPTLSVGSCFLWRSLRTSCKSSRTKAHLLLSHRMSVITGCSLSCILLNRCMATRLTLNATPKIVDALYQQSGSESLSAICPGAQHALTLVSNGTMQGSLQHSASQSSHVDMPHLAKCQTACSPGLAQPTYPSKVIH